MSEDWLDRADWQLRSPEFGGLHMHKRDGRVVAMDYTPRERATSAEWMLLRKLWLDLPPHPHVLEAVDRGEGATLLLRYAALYWQHPGIQLHANRRAGEMIAEWGDQVTRVFSMLRLRFPADELSQFLHPVVRIDLGGAARVAFLPVDPGERRRCDEPMLVYAIGQALQAFCAGESTVQTVPLENVLQRCLHPDPAGRYRTLDELLAAWREVGARDAVRTGEQLAVWTLSEAALGDLAFGAAIQALHMFDRALLLDPRSRLAALGRMRALALLGIVAGEVGGQNIDTHAALRFLRRRPEGRAKAPRISWAEASEMGQALERDRAFAEAVAVYHRAIVTGADELHIHTALARCYLASGAPGPAVDYAQRALVVDSKQVEAHAIRARGYLALYRYDDALKCAGVWLAAARDDADAHYTKGRALLALARHAEARDAFDRALALRPDMIEAMLLRREADRSMIRLREEVGTQPQLELELPEHLAGLRDPLARGRIDDVIAALERADYDGDAAARLVHARCLAFQLRFAEAAVMFDRAMPDRAAILGKGHVMLALDRAAEALELFDRACALDRGDLEAIEGRALALRELGRDAEADDAMQKVYAATGGRSELRVGAVVSKRP